MKKKILLGTTVISYVIILFVLVFLKDNIRGVNLIPFSFIKDYVVDKQPLGVSNIVGNILMFIPMGILLSIKEQRRDKVLISLMGITACIEILQYVLSRGIFDIDDIILNVVGGLIGIACYKISKILGDKSDTTLLMLLLSVFFVLTAFYVCLHFGVFGFRIRIF